MKACIDEFVVVCHRTYIPMDKEFELIVKSKSKQDLLDFIGSNDFESEIIGESLMTIEEYLELIKYKVTDKIPTVSSYDHKYNVLYDEKYII